jgi:nucleotide-binding universal stress UspA family protein
MTSRTLQKILVPTDLSDFSRGAAAWAAMFHRRLGSRITLLHAAEPHYPVDILDGAAGYGLLDIAEFRELRSQEIRTFAADAFPDCADAVETIVVEAAAAKAIVDTADRIEADVILMGTHGRRGWRRALLGSVTENVVRATQRPLMSVPATFLTPRGPEITTILCPVNFTSIATSALEDAVSLAGAFGAELLIVHVSDSADDAPLQLLEDSLTGWVDPTVRQRCRYSQVVAYGDAAEQVLDIAQQASVDLIVIGAQHKRFSDTTVLGTTSERIVRFAAQPVWTVVAAPTVADEPVRRRKAPAFAGSKEWY